MNADTALLCFSALAQSARLALFRLLVEAGPDGLAASQIGEAPGIPPSSLSFHLKNLNQAGLIDARIDGRFIVYSANFEAMNELIGFLTENCCRGQPCSTARNTATKPSAKKRRV